MPEQTTQPDVILEQNVARSTPHQAGMISDTKEWIRDFATGYIEELGCTAVRTWHSLSKDGGPLPWTNDSVTRANRYAARGLQVVATAALRPESVDEATPVGDVMKSFDVLSKLDKRSIVTMGNEINHKKYWPGGDAVEAARNWYLPLAKRMKADGYRVATWSFYATDSAGQVRDLWKQLEPLVEPGVFDYLVAHIYADTAKKFEDLLMVYVEIAARLKLELIMTEYGVEADRNKPGAVELFAREMPGVQRAVQKHTKISCFYTGSYNPTMLPFLIDTRKNPPTKTLYFEPMKRAIAGAKIDQQPAPPPAQGVDPFTIALGIDDLVRHARKNGAHVKLKPGRYETDQTINLDARDVVIDLTGATIFCSKPYQKEVHPVIKITGHDVQVIGGFFDCPADPHPHRYVRWLDVVSPAADVTISGVTMINGGEFLNSRGANRLGVYGCNVGVSDRSLRAYGVWISGGEGHRIQGNVIRNSTDEHCIRITDDARDTLVVDNSLYQRDSKTSDMPQDMIKGCITCQRTIGSIIERNYCDGGPITSGPLGGGDGNAPERAKSVTIRNNKVVGHLIGIAHGSEGFVIENNVADQVKIEGYSDKYKRGTSKGRVDGNALKTGVLVLGKVADVIVDGVAITDAGTFGTKS